MPVGESDMLFSFIVPTEVYFVRKPVARLVSALHCTLSNTRDLHHLQVCSLWNCYKLIFVFEFYLR